ncbi:DUF58 domain-containing protein [Paraburkholderia kururiensis]|uniref:DUF58 domain-containing protein n=1 Tax=Paraburkholderia kururiensis TaxID=984307 RepID=UPI000F8659E6|nr:VWA domain-containing protein [Paraburkholderia kururiensis]
MKAPREFHYRLPGRASGFRPGSHPGTSFGPGQEFALHARLVDYPDPRRLDLRASIQSVRGEWLVRLNLQRVAVPVQVIVDVSASMRFGVKRSKLHVVADFVEALGYSAFRSGDRVGMAAFDHTERNDLSAPPRYGRGSGDVMAAMLRSEAAASHADMPTPWNSAAAGAGNGTAALARVVAKLAGRQALVFIVSDFHWPLDGMPAILDMLLHAHVVPMVVWDPAELDAPERGGLLDVRDMETGARRTVWLSGQVRAKWREAVARRRAELVSLFGKRAMAPFFMEGEFEPEALSRYFLEQSV